MLFIISNFFLEMVMLLSAHLCSIVDTRSSSSVSVAAYKIVSSTIFIAYGRSAIMMSDCRHHSSDDAFTPIGGPEVSESSLLDEKHCKPTRFLVQCQLEVAVYCVQFAEQLSF